MAERTTKAEHWVLDKKIPITLIVTILIQTATAIWWASKVEERVSVLERTSITSSSEAREMLATKVELNRSVENLQYQINSNKELTATSIGMVRDRLNSIESKLDRLIERSKK